MGGKNLFNWVEDNTHKSQTMITKEFLNKHKVARYKDKKYQLVKVSDHPLTYKEVEIK
jgi:hypothetical protein